jgi:hypothetical protein
MTHRERQLSDFVNSSPDERERECADLPDRAIDRQLATHREAPSCNGSQQESQKLTANSAGECPRTDALMDYLRRDSGCEPEGNDFVVIEFLRQLERELNAKSRELKGVRKEMPSILFDGPTVYANLTDRELGRTSTTNVSDVLNAIVRALRKERSAIDSALHHDT